MTNQYDTLVPSQEQIQQIRSTAKFYKYLAVGIIALSLVVSFLSVYHGSESENIKDILVAKANENAETAKEQAKSAEGRIKDAVARAEEAIAKQKELEQTNLKLSIELEKLKFVTGDRFIPQKMEELLRAELLKSTGKKVRIECIGANDEPLVFAKSIEALFKSAQWKTEFLKPAAMQVPQPRGIHIVAIGDKNKNIAMYIYDHFFSLGYKCEKGDKKDGDVDLWIGIAPK